jgi:AraC family transcriptional regulator
MPGNHDVAKAIGRGLAGWQRDLAVRALLSDLSADFPVAELAGRCGLSRSYFGRAFKVSMGLPPHRWLMRYRVQCAQEMLERTTESIVAIAGSCGFADQSHLTRVFHAIVGVSPAAWRRWRKAGAFQGVARRSSPESRSCRNAR